MIKKFDVQNLKIVLKTKEIKIEEAIPGQMVLAYDINNKKKCFRQITETHKPIVKKENQIKIQTKSGTEIITSKWHPTLVSKVKNMKYIRADQIKIKDSLVGDSNTNDHVVSIDLNPNINEEFIDLTVEEHHNYFTKTTGTKKVVIHNTMGFHTLLQEKQIPFDCFDSFRLNNLIFKHLDEQTKLASQNLAKEYGEPEWCSGLGIRNTHRIALAPTVTNAIISGNVSPSVEPWTANAFARKTAKGTFIHRNKTLEKLLESKGQNTEQVWNSIVAKEGSVQHLTCLTKEEKEVFLTAREINQFVIVKLAGQRQQYIDQAQSINLFFPSNVNPKYFHEVHILAWEQQLKTLYYCRTGSVLKGEAGTKEYKREAEECKACEG